MAVVLNGSRAASVRRAPSAARPPGGLSCPCPRGPGSSCCFACFLSFVYSSLLLLVCDREAAHKPKRVDGPPQRKLKRLMLPVEHELAGNSIPDGLSIKFQDLRR